MTLDQELFISCGEHLEPLLIEELTRLGISGVRKSYRGVNAPKTIENVYRINYLSRIATRVLWPLRTFTCPDREALYREAKKIAWMPLIDETKTFAIDSNVFHSKLRHSLFAAQVVKDAICDQIREKKHARPSVELKNPDVQLHLFIHNQTAILSFDTSGAPLYKRGWKTEAGEATLPETIAAAILYTAGYSGDEILCDPFCGSGTLLIEAAQIATQTPAGYFRDRWGFIHLSEHTQEKWETFKLLQDCQRVPLKRNKIFGADRNPAIVTLCQSHLEKTGWKDHIAITAQEIAQYTPPAPPTLLVTDPPFGMRMATSQELYTQLGQFIRNRCAPNARAFVLCPDEQAPQNIGLPYRTKTPLYYGGIKAILCGMAKS